MKILAGIFITFIFYKQRKSYSRISAEIIVTVFVPIILDMLVKKLVAVRFILLFLWVIELVLLCFESRNKKRLQRRVQNLSWICALRAPSSSKARTLMGYARVYKYF